MVLKHRRHANITHWFCYCNIWSVLLLYMMPYEDSRDSSHIQQIMVTHLSEVKPHMFAVSLNFTTVEQWRRAWRDIVWVPALVQFSTEPSGFLLHFKDMQIRWNGDYKLPKGMNVGVYDVVVCMFRPVQGVSLDSTKCRLVIGRQKDCLI